MRCTALVWMAASVALAACGSGNQARHSVNDKSSEQLGGAPAWRHGTDAEANRSPHRKETQRQWAAKSSAVRLRSKPRPSDAAPAEVGTHRGATP